MNYQRLTNEELSKCKYPNLIAEIIESGYSTSTLADFMGLGSKKNGRYRQESDPEVWDKINGKENMLVDHCAGLCKYYGVKYDYMFSLELHIVSDKPVAYWHWLAENEKQKAELKKGEEIRTIEFALQNRPELLEFIKLAKTLNTERLRLAIGIINSLAEK